MVYRGLRLSAGAAPRGARGLPCPAAGGHLWGLLAPGRARVLVGLQGALGCRGPQALWHP